MPAAPPAPAENFSALIAWLTHTVVTRLLLGRLPQSLANPIIDRLRAINQCLGRIAARVAAGRYTPRRATGPRRRGPARPRAPSPLPRKNGWLVALVPEAAASRGQLECFLRDPAAAALIAAAPATLGRPLRSLCRMLGVEVPPVIAAPARPRRPRPARPAKPRPPPRPPRPDAPAWMHGLPRIPWTQARIHGARRRP